jgi:dTDP-4-amino-4,6-dideoxygalactose transaminase
MGEIEAELARYQIESFDSHIDHRVNSSLKLLKMLSQVPGLILPRSDNNLDHDFYIIGMRLHDDLKGKRDLIAEALKAEGLQILLVGYQALHRLPSFKGYRQEDLLQVNELHDSLFLGLYMCGHYFSDTDLEKIAEAFSKVMEYYIK